MRRIRAAQRALEVVKRWRIGGERLVARLGRKASLRLRNSGSHAANADQMSYNFRSKHHFGLKFGVRPLLRLYSVPTGQISIILNAPMIYLWVAHYRSPIVNQNIHDHAQNSLKYTE
jgi:hypothetical protein